MRIVQTFLSPVIGGAERHAIELANELTKRHEVALLIRRLPRAAPARAALRQWLAPEIPVLEVGATLPGLYMRRALSCFDPELVHSHQGRAARHAGRWLSHLPTVATLHTGYCERDHASARLLICVTERQRREIPPSFAGRIATVGNWTCAHRRLQTDEVAMLRRTCGAGEDDFLIGSVGRLAKGKGIDLLLEAFRRAALPDSRLAIVGDGPVRAGLEASAGPNVRFLGFRPDVKDLYQAFDLLAITSHRETFSLVAAEAMAAGLPIVATSAVEILQGTPAYLVPANDPDTLAVAFGRVHRDGQRRVIYDLTRFSVDARTAEIEALYASLLSSPTRAPRGMLPA